ncbi:MAG: DNA-3-methyladenine glycosylase [Acidimicrobiaceae bacterium]|nr:DNA-3-methyladenine glycosylase [Acidimicrobiaceae bacterium]
MKIAGERFCHRSYFERPSDVVAEGLIGALMVVRDGEHEVRAMVVETEAYGGRDDPASHAFRGSTPRSAIMFGPAGFLYVYLSYGLHWCLNVVTEGVGTPSAVLLRAAEIVDVDGVRSPDNPSLLRGPGNLTRGLGITGADNASDCCDEVSSRVSFRLPSDDVPVRVERSARVGISRAQERLSRYFLPGSPAVSTLKRPRS